MSMKILELHAEHIKRIRVVTIKPTTNVVRINGENGSGKTSSLDSILWALQGAGAIDLKPVREGESRGLIRLKLGDQDVEFIITRVFNASTGTTKLQVQGADGGIHPKPQQKLAELFGSFSLDPQAFQRMSDRERMDVLKQIVKFDIDLDAMDREIERDAQRRAELSRDIDTQKGRVATYASSIVTAMVVDPIDTSELLRQMSQASEADRTRAAEMRRRVDIQRSIDDGEKKIAENTAEIADLEARLGRLRGEVDAINVQNHELRAQTGTWGPLPPLVDLAHIQNKITDAQTANAAREKQRSARENHETASTELRSLEAQRDDVLARIDERRRIKAAAISAAKYPIPGLSFGDGGVLFNGVPFNQASSAEQLRASFAIAASTKPKLPVVLIKDGSLLDDKSMAMLEQLAEEYGAQVWIERVGADDVGIVLENGEVVAVDGRPVPRESGDSPAATT